MYRIVVYEGYVINGTLVAYSRYGEQWNPFLVYDTDASHLPAVKVSALLHSVLRILFLRTEHRSRLGLYTSRSVKHDGFINVRDDGKYACYRLLLLVRII